MNVVGVSNQRAAFGCDITDFASSFPSYILLRNIKSHLVNAPSAFVPAHLTSIVSYRDHCSYRRVIETNHTDWLPNHMLVVHVLLLFAILNPLVIPFGFIYFCVEAAVVRNQVSTSHCSPSPGR